MLPPGAMLNIASLRKILFYFLKGVFDLLRVYQGMILALEAKEFCTISTKVMVMKVTNYLFFFFFTVAVSSLFSFLYSLSAPMKQRPLAKRSKY